MPPELPARIGPYDVVGLIGSGHLGSVYRAFDQAHTRSVAIRVLSPDLLADATRLERFRRGVRTSATVVHDNLIRVLDEGQDGDLVYVVTEFVDGCALFDRLQSSRLTLAEAIHVLRDMSDGLGAAHRAGLVHGDLNPRNVLVSRDLSVVKVGDFGTADVAQEEESTRTAVLARARTGVLLYRAPELGRARGEASVRSDLYSLGVIAVRSDDGQAARREVQPAERPQQPGSARTRPDRAEVPRDGFRPSGTRASRRSKQTSTRSERWWTTGSSTS